MAVERIGLPLARRIALAAQGFGSAPPVAPGRLHLRRTLDRLHLHQIDSVNVLTRAHYLPRAKHAGDHRDDGGGPRRGW